MPFFKLLLIFLIFSGPVAAKKLYQYVDERGIRHYTDKAPQTSQPVTVRQVKVNPEQRVWLIKSGTERQPAMALRNDYPGPVEVEIDFTSADNVYAEPSLPKRFVIPPGQSDKLIRFGAIDAYRPYKFSLQYSYTLGAPTTAQDEAQIYLPPLAANASFPIAQAFGGKFSHTDPQNRYAVDIAMPEGTPVHAAKAGMVMEVENDFFNSGINKAYRSRANSIRILHTDGSMAVYAHLALEKAQVYPGLKVDAGQLIGYSGNTGFSSGPHLHFAIQINAGMALVSVPFQFAAADGTTFTPEAGAWLSGFSTISEP